LEILAILIGLILLAVVGYYVSRPLMQSKHAAQANGMDVLSLEARRDSLYTQIKELDLDHATGKVNDEDHTALRADLVAQAAEVLKQIDGVAERPAAIPAARPPAPKAAQDDDIEARIAARRKTRSASAPKKTDAEIEAAIAARRKVVAPAAAAAALTCPKCGKPINADDAFCAKCGASLQPQAAPQSPIASAFLSERSAGTD
jgi:hypothetical protein